MKKLQENEWLKYSVEKFQENKIEHNGGKQVEESNEAGVNPVDA